MQISYLHPRDRLWEWQFQNSVNRRKTPTLPQAKDTEAALKTAATQKVQPEALYYLQSIGRISFHTNSWAILQMLLQLPPNATSK